MSFDNITADDYGQTVTLTITDPDTSAAADVSAYTTAQQIFLKDPSGNISSALTAAFVSDGSDGKVVYTLADGDIDEAGRWEYCTRVTSGSAVLTSEWTSFQVSPTPGTFGPVPLKAKLAAVASDNLILYLPMDETEGSTADNYEGTAERDGTYSSVTLGQSQAPFTCPLFDKTGYVDFYSASLNAAKNMQEGTASIFCKVFDASVLTDGAYRAAYNIQVDDNNENYIWKTSTNNLFRFRHEAGATVQVETKTISTVDWFHVLMKWSTTGGYVKYYYNASIVATDGAPGTWAGNLDADDTLIGAASKTPGFPWYGWLSQFQLWSTPLTDDQITYIHNQAGI